jgi:NAD(P)-dependent dehydrogenase (short-subunit alcohol dehydrogenase family)
MDQARSLDLFRLSGHAAMVTGAARGLGRAMALALADAGADIVAVDAAPMDGLAEEVESWAWAACSWKPICSSLAQRPLAI